MNSEPDNTQLAERLRTQLQDSEEQLDAVTLARLQAARRRAVDTVGRPASRARHGMALGGAASAAVALLVVALWQGNGGIPEFTGDDWELLAEGDLQLIEELDFYDWLPEEDTAG